MIRTLILSFALCAGALASGAAFAGIIEGKVIEVVDGATLTVLARRGASLHRIRLAGIDAPNVETPAGGKARASLHRLVHGKMVRVDTNAIDSWGRLVGLVTLPPQPDCKEARCADAIDPALAQLRAGQAWVEVTSLLHQNEELQKTYTVVESTAKSKRTGLWRDFVVSNNALRPRP